MTRRRRHAKSMAAAAARARGDSHADCENGVAKPQANRLILQIGAKAKAPPRRFFARLVLILSMAPPSRVLARGITEGCVEHFFGLRKSKEDEDETFRG